MAGPPPGFLRMFGGVAGNMDQIASETLQATQNGQYAFLPSKKYFNQAMMFNQTAYNAKQQNRPMYATPIIEQEEETNNMDISKYIGRQTPKKDVLPQPNSQLEVMKMALKPLNDQLEKVCILLGMIYQALDNREQIGQQSEPELVDEPSKSMTPQEEIEKVEKMLRSRPKSPTTEEISEVVVDGVDDIT